MFPRIFNRNLATRTPGPSIDGPDEIYYHDNVYRMDICKFLHACSSPHQRGGRLAPYVRFREQQVHMFPGSSTETWPLGHRGPVQMGQMKYIATIVFIGWIFANCYNVAMLHA
ncbi:hypothetical protein AVEN_201367-1 [Araneus ventricosus]|uniref:Uncharacterized protein n=2 Tax=Araneus ventricosus TaxID=182803 RepID=A0A4Y2H391_ARAVE|nr:hypothetical protein AVEN_45743-1 [Araneus ventricosus]GBM59228.1 hypothetical protein AVEN_201367-1 [Araneus ventricosus]